MKAAFFLAVALLLAPVYAGTTEAESDVFEFDARDSAGTNEAVSGVFGMDARNLGNSASGDAGEFVLNTLGSTPTNLEVVGPSTVVAGSRTDYRVIWHAGNSDIDVTAGVRWRSFTDSPGNSGMVQATLYAGETNAPATVRIVASYQAITGHSQESPPFSITITPHLRASVAATQTGAGKFTLTATPANHQGAATVAWDATDSGNYIDDNGNLFTLDCGSWTGTKTVSAQVVDEAGHTVTTACKVVVNKPLAANQPTVAKPAYDPAGFSLFLPDGQYDGNGKLVGGPSPFVFNAGGINRRDRGLVVIVHGLYSDAKQKWVADMGKAVESRCWNTFEDPPDIALMDWSDVSANPSETTPAEKLKIKRLFTGGLMSGNLWAVGMALGVTASEEALKVGLDACAAQAAAITKGQQLANWIYSNSRGGATAQIDPDRPIHLIGHSAGGFVVGEAANLLKHLSEPERVYVDRVTMLDTPLVVRAHIAAGADGFPNPGTVERYASSVWGSLAFGWYVWTNSHYRYENIWTSVMPLYNVVSHGDAHDWFTRTAWKAGDSVAELTRDGFYYSPIINANTRIPKPYTPPQAMPPPPEDGPPQPAPPPGDLPDIVPTGWQTFGNAALSDGDWTLTELDDAGIWKELALPQTAATLAFEFHFLTAGDGDFLAVHFGDNPVLYQGLDLPLSRDAWLPVEIPLDLLPALDGKLVFTLVSRGGVNAQVQLRNLRITQSEDLDADGLVAADETANGSDPRNPDSDSDGISDGDEVNHYGTDPLRADTDGDGQADAMELAAGTSPLANGSVFRVTALTRTPQGGMELQWTGAAGKSYRVLRSPELGTGNFDTLAFGVPATVPTTTHTDPNPPPLRAFYWIEVE